MKQQKATHTLIVGLGKTGVSCVRYLQAHNAQINIAVTDSQDNPPGLEEIQEMPNITLFIGRLSAEAFAMADNIILSPGVDIKHPLIEQAIRDGKSVIGDIELFGQQNNQPVIAITGSNGKSTVTMLVYKMLLEAGHLVKLGGNIGIPVLDLLRDKDQQHTEFYVLELSSFQLETTYSLNPMVAVVLNISPDHMDRYDSLTHYLKTKQRIYRGKGVMVINADDEQVLSMAEADKVVITFSQHSPTGIHFGIRKKKQYHWLYQGNTALISEQDIKIKGQHNLTNCLAALALGEVAGLSMPSMLSTLRKFTGLPHRLQWIANKRGADWYNDSKATNIGATIAAIKSFNRATILLLGGDAKGANFDVLAPHLTEHITHIIAYGKDAKKVAQSLTHHHSIEMVNTLAQAVNIALPHISSDSNVLLAPACASTDQYQNFEKRGEHFIALVHEL